MFIKIMGKKLIFSKRGSVVNALDRGVYSLALKKFIVQEKDKGNRCFAASVGKFNEKYKNHSTVKRKIRMDKVYKENGINQGGVQ